MNDRRLYRQVAHDVFLLILLFVGCRFSYGIVAAFVAMLGCMWVIQGRRGRALGCYCIFPLMVVMNPIIIPKNGMTGLILRLAPMVMALLIIMVSTRMRGREKMPFAALMPYMMLMVVSSTFGWCPKVSYLKIVNFMLFLAGFWLGSKDLLYDDRSMYELRGVLLALAVVVVYGSIATLPFPNIAYYTMVTKQGLDASDAEAGVAAIEHVASYGGTSLFSGIVNHSQALGPLLGCCFGFVAGDMLFVQGRPTWLHLSLLGAMPVLMFMTRSRCALLTFCVAGAMIALYAMKRIRLPPRLRQHLHKIVKLGMVALVCFAVVGEVRGGKISKWIRKTNSSNDTRNLGEALTSSRMGLIERGLDEFYSNPVTGIGFQVNFQTKEFYGNSKGLVLSAPVEKGLLPIVVLGEGGVVGAILFIIFLWGFYTTCKKKHYTLTAALFTVYLTTNVGEATFFSPGGVGGAEWIFCAVGGFLIDMLLLRKRRFGEPGMAPLMMYQGQPMYYRR